MEALIGASDWNVSQKLFTLNMDSKVDHLADPASSDNYIRTPSVDIKRKHSGVNEIFSVEPTHGQSKYKLQIGRTNQLALIISWSGAQREKMSLKEETEIALNTFLSWEFLG